MKEYHKIVTAYKRDPDNNFRTLLEGQYALPEFEYLAYNDWVWTEKVDGTNIRIMFDGEKVTFGGKTDRAQIYAPLIEVLQAKFYSGAMANIFKDYPVCLYGEGFGAKIQKGGGNYIANGVDFVLFDVWVNGVWLERINVEDIANKLEIAIVPIVDVGTLYSAIDLTKCGFWSAWGDFTAEGLIMKPKTELQSRTGNRIITKIKHKDFS